MKIKKFLENDSLGKLLVRLNVGGLILFHGIFKMKTNIGEIKSWIVQNNLPEMLSYGVFVGELIAPILLLIGLYVRFSAFIVMVNMLIAIYFLHSKGFAPFGFDQFGAFNAEADLLFLIPSLALIFLGGGSLTLPSIWKVYKDTNQLTFKNLTKT